MSCAHDNRLGEFTINYLQTHYKMAFRLSDDALAYMTKAMGDDAKFERTRSQLWTVTTLHHTGFPNRDQPDLQVV